MTKKRAAYNTGFAPCILCGSLCNLKQYNTEFHRGITELHREGFNR